MNTKNGNPAHWVPDTERIEKAMEEAVLDAVRSHKLMGDPIVIWRDGQVVWIPAEEIELTEETNGSNDQS
jgi:hypothetical protein